MCGEELRDNIVELEGQLTNSARMAVVTGDTVWEAKYRRLHARLETVMDDARYCKFPDDVSAFLSQLQNAHLALRLMEKQAFDLIHKENKQSGLQTLTQEKYDKQRQHFAEAIYGFTTALRKHLADRLSKERNREIGSLFIAFGIFTLSLAFWLLLIHRLHRWGNTLAKEIAERRKAEEKYSNLFAYAGDMIFIVDPSTSRLLDVNEKAAHMLGYSRTELLQRSLSDVDVETGTPFATKQSAIPGATDSTTCEATYESTYRRKDGATFPVEVRGKLIGYGNKTVYQCFSYDITTRKRLHEELLQAHKMEAMGQMASGIAHDFNNLLTAISGYASLAKETLTPHHAAIASLERVEQAAEQAGDVTKALLAFSRKQPEEKQPVELRALVEETVRLFQRILPASIDIVTALDLAQTVWVKADKGQLQQVLLNLVINAKDAMPDGGTLSISLVSSSLPGAEHPTDGKLKNPVACLKVSDTGVGMSPEAQARIFEPFFSTKPKGYGTGLGLATVYGIVTRYGGWLTVASRPGKGSTFTVTLPTICFAATNTVTRTIKDVPHGHGETILLAEDQRYVREIMATTLEDLGYMIVQVSDGPALLEAYSRYRQTLRLLIVDLDLPGKSGIACLREIRVDDTRTPVILTGTPGFILDIHPDDNTALLHKPFQMPELGCLVSALLRESPKTVGTT